MSFIGKLGLHVYNIKVYIYIYIQFTWRYVIHHSTFENYHWICGAYTLDSHRPKDPIVIFKNGRMRGQE
jgi:hypothetical protein